MWLFDIEQAILVLGIRIVLCESQQCQSSLSWFVSSTEGCAESLECIMELFSTTTYRRRRLFPALSKVNNFNNHWHEEEISL